MSSRMLFPIALLLVLAFTVVAFSAPTILAPVPVSAMAQLQATAVAPTGAATVAPTAAAPAATPTPGKPLDQVVVGLNIDANTLDPHFVSSTQEYGVLKNVFEHLVWINHKTGGFDPRLALSWTQPDPLTWVFKLRQGVTFQNGEPFNAQAVKYTIDRTTDATVKSNNRFPGAVNLDRVEVVDDYTVRIITKKPSPTMLTQLWILQIVPAKYYASTPLQDLARKPVGSGPYKLTEWVKDDHMTFEAWDGYWGPKPAVKRIVYRVLPDVSTRLAELETNGIDIAIDVPPDRIDSVKKLTQVDTRTVQTGRRVFFGIRADKPPLDKPEVRQALNYAINWDSINKNLLNGIGQRMAVWVTAAFANPDIKPYTYDPDKAKALLAQAGLPNGFETSLEVPIARYLKGEDIAQAAAADLAKIGVKVKVVNMEYSAFSQKVITQKNPDGLFLLGLASAFNPYDDLNNFDPAFVFAPYHWEDKEFLDLMSQYPTADDAGRKAISYKAQQIAHDRGPGVWLWMQAQVYGVNKRVAWQPRPDDYIFGEEMAGGQ